jgi:hypothetical protein
LLVEPALGRVLPMSLIMPWGEWLVLAIQLGVLALVIRPDRNALGSNHAATISAVLVLAISHCIAEGLAISPFWIVWTNQVISL